MRGNRKKLRLGIIGLLLCAITVAYAVIWFTLNVPTSTIYIEKTFDLELMESTEELPLGNFTRDITFHDWGKNISTIGLGGGCTWGRDGTDVEKLYLLYHGTVCPIEIDYNYTIDNPFSELHVDASIFNITDSTWVLWSPNTPLDMQTYFTYQDNDLGWSLRINIVIWVSAITVDVPDNFTVTFDFHSVDGS